MTFPLAPAGLRGRLYLGCRLPLTRVSAELGRELDRVVRDAADMAA